VIRNSGQTYLCNHLPKIFGDSFILDYTYCQELMKPVVSNGRLSLLFNVKVMVWHFVSDAHKVMTTIILVILHS
jgi:hypothetical protein